MCLSPWAMKLSSVLLQTTQFAVFQTTSWIPEQRRMQGKAETAGLAIHPLHFLGQLPPWKLLHPVIGTKKTGLVPGGPDGFFCPAPSPPASATHQAASHPALFSVAHLELTENDRPEQRDLGRVGVPCKFSLAFRSQVLWVGATPLNPPPKSAAFPWRSILAPLCLTRPFASFSTW